ncbi:WD repeat and HMG-box DNA-binding protein 1 [Aricia agestis]|uniref:WD repeat and HMG-box DNA-binding protein 1 n=1 Tax=Aricia agestis TaxID=91739 RepID=UPI001C20AAA6|nr:WD repeat and HMG-box DNA-binding protein 1 [Aricia agestis]
MKIDSKPLRYAHAEGHTDVCYSEDGKHIITCGHDGDVRIWLDIEDDDPNSHCVGESAVAVCFKDNRLFVATDNHAVQAYTYPAFDKDGIITRFTAPVTQIRSNAKSEALGCTSENMEAKLCSLEGGAPLFVMSEHKGPVLSIALCPQMKFACTACGDGLLRVWDIDTQKIVKEIPCVPKINTFFAAKVLCRMDFEPSEGRYLAYPNNREIILLDCESWGQRMSFTHSNIKCAISQCMFSPCGQYLAGSTVAGQIAIWEVESGNCLGIIEHPTSHNVTAMAWNPKGNGVLVYCDLVGQLGMLTNCYGKSSEDADTNDIEVIEREDDDNDLDNLIENYESEDEHAISLEKIRNETMGVVESERVESRASEPPPARRTCPPQPPFQTGATPMHLEHRYMCWNDVGIVRCHTGENGESTIDVEFHDTSLHHAIHLNNYLNHTMASLSSTVLVLACETPSKLVCISLAGSSREWSVSMPDTEEVVCVCAGAVVAAATSARLLRLYTPLGTQRQVISLLGPIVTLAARDSTVMAVYHRADPGETDQNLAMDIVTLNSRQIRSRTVGVPLTSRSRLTWAGLTDAGSACAYDSTGMLRLFDAAANLWLPVLDAAAHSRGAADSWAIVSISEVTQKVRAILCRGTSFPLTVPKPIVTELPIQIPLCELDSEKSQYEEQLVRWAHTAAEVDVKTARETALKLFALACRSEIEQRALELMELLRDERLLPLAAKYASRSGRMHLADKLTSLADVWRDQPDLPEPEMPDEHENGLDTTQDHNTSLIIPQKSKKKEADPIKPVPIKASPGGIRNPFKKQAAAKTTASPLSLTERTLVEVHSENTTENDDPLKPNAGETFMDWFTRNKSVLEQQNPGLTPSELTRQSVRTFKSIQASNTENSQKRKLEEDISDTPVTSAPKQSKLSAFAFSKS